MSFPTVARRIRPCLRVGDPRKRGSQALLLLGLCVVACIGFVGSAAASPPSNDNFIAAQTVSGASGNSTVGSNTDATAQPAEPRHNVDGSGNPVDGPLHSVWYQWTAPSSDPIVFDTCAASFPSVLSVYTGNTVSTLNRVPKDDWTSPCSATFTPASGTTYMIAVDGASGNTGVFTLRWYPAAAPSNDNLANATPISGVSGGLNTESNLQATSEPGEPAANRYASVWYTWTAPQDGTYSFAVCNASFDTVLAVYTGNSSDITSLSTVARNDDDCGFWGVESSVTFDATSGTQYFLAVSSYHNPATPSYLTPPAYLFNSGSFGLTWDIKHTAPPPPPPGTVDLTVNAYADAPDANPGDGTCADAAGYCTLRAAVMEADTVAGTNTIHIPAGTYKLTIPDDPSCEATNNDASCGDLNVTEDTNFIGAGSDQTYIDANNLDRALVFAAPWNNTVTISGFTIANGKVSGTESDTGDANGGGMYLMGPEVSNFADVVIRDSSATGDGGGLYTCCTTIDHATNIVVCCSHAGGNGGGINSSDSWGDWSTYWTGGPGSVTGGIDGLTVTKNSADGQGGGWFTDDSVFETKHFTIDDNTAGGQGGGIYGWGETDLFRDGTVSGNTSGQEGGGAYLWASETFIDTTFDGNTATGYWDSNGNAVPGIGGGMYANGSEALDNATFSNNTAIAGPTTPPATVHLGIQLTAPQDVTGGTPGDAIVYTAVVSNTGPGDAADVQVTDTLPAWLSYVSSPDCTNSGGTLTCDVGTLAAGDLKAVHFTARANVPGDTNKDNTASVTTSSDPSVNPSSTANTKIWTTLPADPGTPTAPTAADAGVAGNLSGSYTYEVTFVTSAGETMAGPSSNPVVVTGRRINLTNIPAGGSGTTARKIYRETNGQYPGYVLVGTINNNTTTTLSDNVSDSAFSYPYPNPPYAPAPNVDEAYLSVDASTPGAVQSGNTLTFAVVATNNGPHDATALQFTETLPRGTTFDHVDPASTSSCSDSGATVTCDLSASAVGEGQSKTVYITVDVAAACDNSIDGVSVISNPDQPNPSAWNDYFTNTQVAFCGAGGGMYSGGSQYLENNTFYGNSAAGPGGAGGGIYTWASTYVYNATIANNSADHGGGVFDADSSFLVGGTIIANNTSSTPGEANCAELDGNSTPYSSGYNISSDSSCDFTNPGYLAPDNDGNLTNTDPLLGPLQDNGGPVKTMALLPGSPAIDASRDKLLSCISDMTGYLTSCPGQTDNRNIWYTGSDYGNPLTDARGVARPQDAHPDIGAYEAAASDPSPVNAAGPTAPPCNTPPPAEPTLSIGDFSHLERDTGETKFVLKLSAAADVPVTVDYTTQNGSGPDAAIAGPTTPGSSTGDYAAKSGSVTIPAGDTTAAINVDVHGDTVIEPDETFKVDLSNPTNATLANSSGTATIINDDFPSTPQADISLTKVGNPDPVNTNGTLTYTLTATNNGPDDATNVSVTDSLPAGVSYVSSTPSQGSCNQSPGTVSCSLGSLANGSSATVLVVVTAPGAAGSITNTADVIASENDPDLTNNHATADTTVVAGSSADLAITKTADPNPVETNGTLTYTLTATNNGPDDATGVQVTDTLPNGVTYQSATPSQGSCSESSGTITCSLGAVTNSGQATVTVVVNAPSGAGQITNTASVSANEADPDLSNNQASVATDVVDADLAMTVTAAPNPVYTNGNLTYVLTATNNGPEDATGVQVTDTLPAGVIYQSVTPSQGSCSESSGTITCSLASVASGSEATATVVVTAPPISGQITNTASVSAIEPDPDLSNNQASVTTDAIDADLSITKSASPNPVYTNGTLTYSLLATNNGPAAATGVSVVDTLPPSVDFVSASTAQGSCAQASGTVTCGLGGLASGNSVAITIVVRAPAATGQVTNTAVVSANEPDPNLSNNQASATTTVIAQPAPSSADLSILKTGSPDPVSVNGQETYTLTATNNGPDNATGVRVVDTLPSGVVYVSSAPSQGSCSAASGTVTCSLGALASGGSATVTIVATSPSTPGQITNNADISADPPDPNLANNHASYTTTVIDSSPPPCSSIRLASSTRTLVYLGWTSVRIAATGHKGAPAAGILVHLTGSHGISSRTGTTNAQGRVRFRIYTRNMKARVRLVTPCASPLTLRARMICPRITVRHRTLHPNEIGVIRVLILLAGRPFAHARIDLLGAGIHTHATTSRRGRFGLRLLPRRAGAITIRAHRLPRCPTEIGVVAPTGVQLTG